MYKVKFLRIYWYAVIDMLKALHNIMELYG